MMRHLVQPRNQIFVNQTTYCKLFCGGSFHAKWDVCQNQLLS